MSAAIVNMPGQQISQLQNQYVPTEGPKSIPLLLDFSSQAEWQVDLSDLQRRGFISMVQTVFVDLSGSSNDLTITVGTNGQQIVCKANTQGYYTILCPNPAKLQFDSSSGGSVIPVQLINVPIPGAVWPTI